jgi:hypothetical protein
MHRRINSSDFDNVKAKTTHLDLPVVSVLANPQHEWKRIAHGGRKIAGTIDVDWKLYNPVDYLFSQCSIVSSVQVEPNGYYIKPVCNQIVNANGNSWTNEILLATFKSFIGGFNFQDHIQIPSQSKGTILDAVLRPFTYKDVFGNSADVFICDILVATSRKHWDLIQKIQTGLLSTLSMGTTCKHVTCSKCGGVFADDDDSCDHIKHELLSTFKDENGITRIVSEICGRMIKNPVTGEWEGDPESNKFIEASWVENPAFKGAVLNHFVEPQGFVSDKYAALMEEKSLDISVSEMMGLRVADRFGMAAIRLAQQEYMRTSRNETIERILKDK